MKIPLFKTYSDEEDVNAVAEVIKRGTYWAIGPEVEEFEKAIARYIGRKYALVFNSGTSALHALLLAYDIKGKEVIVPSFTFISTANTVVLAGGIPVFAESESETFGLDADDVERKINKKTRVILPIHYGGFPAKDIEKLRKIADKHKLLLIEDNAESLGASINGKKTGTFGDSAILSFCQNKIISTGEGGAIITDSADIYEKAKLLRSHGRVELEKDYFSSAEDNDYIQVGYNYRMCSMCAALGLSQLKKIDKLISLRREHAKYLNTNLSDIKEIITPKEIKGNFCVYQMYTIILKDSKLRNDLQEFLLDKGVMSKVYFNPAHLKTFYKNNFGCKEGDFKITEELSGKVLTLPLYPHISRKDLDFIISKIKEFFTVGD